jgi:hypothetical protein
VLDLSWVHNELTPYYSHAGRPSIDPVLMIRMLIVGYVSTRMCAIASGRWPRRKRWALAEPVGSRWKYAGRDSYNSIAAATPASSNRNRVPIPSALKAWSRSSPLWVKCAQPS